MPGPIVVGDATAAEVDFAASLVQAAENAGEETDAVQPEPVDTEEEGDEPSADDADDGADDDEPAEDDQDDEPVSDVGGAARERILAGDLAGAAKLLKVDPKVFQVNEPKFKAMREGLTKAKNLEATAAKKEAAAIATEARANAAIKDGKERYGQLVDLKNALKLGEYMAAKEILEALAPPGKTFKDIAEGIVLASKSATPSEIAYKAKLRQLAQQEQAKRDAEEATKKAEAEAAASQTMAAKNLAGATKKLVGTPYAGIAGAPEKLVEIVAANWDPVRGGLKITPEACLKLLGKDPIIAQLVELKRLKSAPKAPKVETLVRQPHGRFQKPAGKLPTHDDEFRASIAEASRLEAAEARTARRGKR